MRWHTRATMVLGGLCLLALPRGPWPDLQETAWRVALWIDAARVERASLPPDAARAALVNEQASTSPLLQPLLDDWQRTADESLMQPVPVTLPYAETLWPDDGRTAGPDAAVQTYAVRVRSDERLRVVTRAGPGARGGVIVDVLDPRVARDGLPSMVGSYGPEPLERRIAPPLDTAVRARREPLASLQVRIQTTPGAHGRFAVLLDVQPALAFPVDTDARSPVRSRFGAARDAGRREHHGIDIFADRGTEVLAAADGVVVRTGDSPRGGLHVWQRAIDERGERFGSLYYAHLDRVDVTPGTTVRRGERLGTVGNTGNARTTPPHLHFGLYRRFEGPIDPLPFTGEARREVPGLQVEATLPRWLQILPRQANLRASPDTGQAPVATLAAGQLVRVDGVLPGARWVRVRVMSPGTPPTTAARVGWIARSLLGPPAAQGAIVAQGALRAAPVADAPELAQLDPDTPVTLLGRFGETRYVRTADGLLGWIEPQDPA